MKTTIQLKHLMLIILVLLAFKNGTAQAPAIMREVSYGGTLNDWATDIKTAGTGYIAVGYSNSDDGDVSSGIPGYNSIWIVRLSVSLSKVWGKSYGQDGLSCIANSIETTSDGGYIVCGGINGNFGGDVSSNHGNFDLWVLKLDASGDLEWQKQFGGTGYDLGYVAKQTSDGGYIIGGSGDSQDYDFTGNHSVGFRDELIIKLNTSGDIVWKKVLGGSSLEGGDASSHALDILQTTDGGYIAVCETFSPDSSAAAPGDVTGNHCIDFVNNPTADYWLVKLNSTGNILWKRTLGGSGTEVPHSITQAADGGYVIAGRSTSDDGDVSSNDGSYDYWVIKTNSLGVIEWNKNYGGSGWDVAFSVQSTADGGYIIGGNSNSTDGDVTGNHGSMDYWMVKLNSAGNLLWQKSLGGSSNEDIGAVVPSYDGGYVVAGSTPSPLDGDVSFNHDPSSSDYWIVRLAGSPVETENLWYADADGDEFGNPLVSVLSSLQPDGYVTDNTDCDDTNPSIHYLTAAISGPSGVCLNNSAVLSAGVYSGYSWSTGASTPSITVLSQGTYVVTVTNSAGCSAVATKVLDFYLTPTVNPVDDQTLINGESSNNFNFSGEVPGIVYGWTNDNPSIGLAENGTGDITTFIATNSTNSPVTANITVTPLSSGFAYITNNNTNTVSVINTASHELVTTITVGSAPIGVTVSPDGSHAYVTNYGSASVSVINTFNNTVEATIPVAQNPTGIDITPDGNFLYVANAGANKISVINTATNTVVTNIISSSAELVGPYAIVVSPDGSSVYVTNAGGLKTVSVISTASNTITANIPVGTSPVGIDISPDGKTLYVVNYDDNTFTVINTSTNTVTATIPVGNHPNEAAVSPDGSKLYVTNETIGSGGITVINATDNSITTFIPSTFRMPQGISVSPDGAKIFVSNYAYNNVSVINPLTNTESALISTGNGSKSLGKCLTGTKCTGDPITFSITVNPSYSITTNAIAPLSYCAGNSISVPYSATGVYNAGNLFKAQLSDANGNFDSPIDIGSIASLSSGTINANIPADTDEGSAYRIRVVSTNPVIDGTNNQSDIQISKLYSWYLDADEDGHYAGVESSCETFGDGWTNIEPAGGFGDCNDDNASVWQSAVLFIDNDGDGYNTGTQSVCYGASIPAGYSVTTIGSGDCNDNNNAVWRSALFYKDNDGDGYDAGTQTVCYGNAVPAGFVTTTSGSDCDDNNGIVHVAPPLTLGQIIGPDGACRGQNGITYLVQPSGVIASYQWTLPAGTSISGSSLNNSINVNFTSSYNGGNICVREANSCGASNQSCKPIAYYSSKPATPGAINGPVNSFCPNTIQTYSVSPVTNASSYNWTLVFPTGTTTATISSGQGTNSINLSCGSNFRSVTLRVSAVNCAGASANQSLSISIVQPNPGAISISGGNKSVCPGDTRNFSVAAVTGAASYNWVMPTGAAIQSGAGTNNIVVGFNSAYIAQGSIGVYAVNSCGVQSTGSSNMTLQINKLGSVGNITVNSSTPVCPTNTRTYSVGTVSNATYYNWSVPSGAIITSGQGTRSISVTYNAVPSGSVSVIVSNGCGNATNTPSLAVPVGSPPVLAGPISGPIIGVCNKQLSYSIAVVPGADSYVWSATIHTAVGPDYTVPFLSTSRTNAFNYTAIGEPSIQLYVFAKNGCGLSFPSTLFVGAYPAAPGPISGRTCVAFPLQGYSIKNVANATSYFWNTSNPLDFIHAGQGKNKISVDFAPCPPCGETDLVVYSENSCGTNLLSPSTLHIESFCLPRMEELTEAASGDIILYPNPSDDKVNIVFNAANEYKYVLEIIDVTGRILNHSEKTAAKGENIIALDVNELAGGIYFVRVTDSVNGNRVMKFIKE